MDLNPNSIIHLIGIGGSGMSAIAKICLELNYRVTGSDLKESVNTIRLKNLGAKIYYTHEAANIREADVVVISSAITPENPELISATQAQIPILKRAQFLSLLMDLFPSRIAIAGTHGKTTTTSMITRIIEMANLKPTYLIGADMNDLGGNAGLGTGKYFVAEADESDGSFLFLNPNVVVITNIEEDHMNYFQTTQNLLSHFESFIGKIKAKNGYLVLNKDDANLQKISPVLVGQEVIYYSLKSNSEVMALDLRHNENGTSFSLLIKGQKSAEVSLAVYGIHNVYNALAAISVGLKENIPLETIIKGIEKFTGTKRRLQLIGEVNKIAIYDDYGHHPTEIKATLQALRSCFKRKIICIFQPHRYTRTLNLLDEFTQCFDDADEIIITEIYSANENKIPGLTARKIVEKIKKQGKNAEFISRKSSIAEKIISKLEPNDLVLTIGAGDIYTVGKELLINLKEKYQKS